MHTQVGSSSLHGMRILLVEEDDRLYCALKETLEDAGCEVLELLARLPDTSEIMPTSHIDAALVDLSWHGLPMTTIARQLGLRRVPTLCIGTVGSAEQFVGIGSVQELQKPFTEQELLHRISETIRTRKSVAEIVATNDSASETTIAAKSAEVNVLHVTCGHCGRLREFGRDETLTSGQLEAIDVPACVGCGRHGSVIGFVSVPVREGQPLETLPVALSSR
jgi:DNA-binding response OmpR family regulator